MTVCVGVAVNDCLVFAADSASSLVLTNPQGNSGILNVYKHGDKVFNLRKGLPICAMTCGMGNVGNASIATLAKELRRRFANGDADWRIDPDSYTVENVAIKARRYIYEERFLSLNPQPAAPHSLEFWVGGYSAPMGGAGHEVWKISIVNGTCGPPEQQLAGVAAGWLVGGQIAPIFRLMVGIDPLLRDSLVSSGMDPATADTLVTHLRGRHEHSMVVTPTMPVIEAIDLADFLVETTKRFFRFLPGADIVGGDTDIAVVTRYEGFKWIPEEALLSRAPQPPGDRSCLRIRSPARSPHCSRSFRCRSMITRSRHLAPTLVAMRKSKTTTKRRPRKSLRCRT